MSTTAGATASATVDTATGPSDMDALAGVARRIREHIVAMCAGPEGGHLGGSLSMVEILTALYFSVLRTGPDRTGDPDRDIFLLSKGHGAIGLYATLAERGYLDVSELAGFGTRGSRLMGHPVTAVPGVEAATGSLGHGLALGAGYALGARLASRDRRVFVLLGDGELQEGSVWEAAMGAATLGLDQLVAVVDRNGLQLTGTTEQICALEPMAQRWRSFGWAVREAPGHDMAALVDALSAAPWQPGRPSVLIAHTVKGAGVPFAAGTVRGHFVTLSERQRARALAALSRERIGAGGE